MSSEVPKPASAQLKQLTVRAVLTGMLLGSVLSLCNIYSGLKLGWSSNMSVTAALLAYGFWQVARGLGASPFGLLENNMNQTAASSAAFASSAGLVAPIPALAMITGQTLTWPLLSLWVFSVMAVGVVVAVGLRRQMLEVDGLPFPMGVATAETLKEMYSRGREAMVRVGALLAGGAAASLVLSLEKLKLISKVAIPGGISLSSPALAAKGITTATFKNLTLAFNPPLLMVGVGALIGMRASLSMLLGAIVAWGIVGPEILDRGWASPGKNSPEANWFGPMIQWMLWPGVAMMVSASLTSFSFSGRSVLRAFRGMRESGDADQYGVPRRWFVRGLLIALVFSVLCQALFWGIPWYIGAFGVLLTFALAIVAARVSGETGITPVGAMGKVTQLTFGLVSPGNATANLMAANVTGGAASQCADMLHDLKTGELLGSWPRHQATAQAFGALAGALAGSAAYLLLVPNPSEMLLTDEWPAPAVAQWKAVAEVFKEGFDKMPPGSIQAILVAGSAGIVLAVLERKLPEGARAFVPSPSAVGLALVIPAYYSVNIVVGAVAALVAARISKGWAERFVIVIASGIIAGESLTGVVFAVKSALGG